jgi:hypothetical protein
VHIYQMVTAHNFAPGFIFLWLQHRVTLEQRHRSGPV